MRKNVRFEDVAYNHGLKTGLAIGLIAGILLTLLVLGLLKLHGLQTRQGGERRDGYAEIPDAPSYAEVRQESCNVLAAVEHGDGSSTVTFTTPGGETLTRVFRPLR